MFPFTLLQDTEYHTTIVEITILVLVTISWLAESKEKH